MPRPTSSTPDADVRGGCEGPMNRPDPKGRTWHKYPDSIFRYYMDSEDDSTRSALPRLAEDRAKARSRISDYDVVWVHHRHIHRYKGEDVQWYTLASERRLTDPVYRAPYSTARPYANGPGDPGDAQGAVDVRARVGPRTAGRLRTTRATSARTTSSSCSTRAAPVKRGKNVDTPEPREERLGRVNPHGRQDVAGRT